MQHMNVLWIWLQIIIETWDGLIKLEPVINHTDPQLHRNVLKHSEHLDFVMQAESLSHYCSVPFKCNDVHRLQLWRHCVQCMITSFEHHWGISSAKRPRCGFPLQMRELCLVQIEDQMLTCFSDISCMWIPPPYADFGSSHQGQSAGRDTSLIIHSKTAWK